jgi:hypothetical protein
LQVDPVFHCLMLIGKSFCSFDPGQFAPMRRTDQRGGRLYAVVADLRSQCFDIRDEITPAVATALEANCRRAVAGTGPHRWT